MKKLFPPDNRKNNCSSLWFSGVVLKDTQVQHRGGGYDCGGIMYHVMCQKKKWVDMVQSRDFFAGKLWTNANRSGAS